MKNILFLFVLFPLLLVSQVEEKKEEFKNIDNIALNGKVYNFKAKYTSSEFTLKICTSDDCFGPTQDFIVDVQPTVLSTALIDFVIAKVDSTLNDTLVTPEARLSLGQLPDKIKNLLESDKSEAQRTTEAVDKFGDRGIARIVLNKHTILAVDDSSKKGHRYNGSKIHFENAVLIFFNNKATTISVEATLEGEEFGKKSLHLRNGDYSIPLRAFSNFTNVSNIVRVHYVLTAEVEKGVKISVPVNAIFDYKNIGEKNIGDFGYSIANQKFRLSTKEEGADSFVVKQRRFLDFFNAVVYSDLMGFNTENSNSVLNAQASLLMPMNLGNWGRISALRQFRITTNIALNNSFEDENRFIGFANEEEVPHFDLLKKNNLNAIICTDLVSIEAKGWFSVISLGYNIGFYRTGYRYTESESSAMDMVSNGQVLSLSHGPYLGFEFRPQDSFGADLMISLEKFSLNDRISLNGRDFRDDIISEVEDNDFLLNHNLINFSSSFYWLTSPGKTNGGVYARLGVAYHTPTDAIFPQFFVGYATNLTSFVNRFKPKEDTTEDN